MNLIAINWEKGANSFALLYFYTMRLVDTVGDFTNMFIRKAVNTGLMSLTKLDVVGHSLGAHAAGYGMKWNMRNFFWLCSIVFSCYFSWKILTTRIWFV